LYQKKKTVEIGVDGVDGWLLCMLPLLAAVNMVLRIRIALRELKKDQEVEYASLVLLNGK